MGRILNKFRKLWDNRNYAKLILYCTVLISATLLIVGLIYYVGILIISFLIERYEAVITVVGICLFIYFGRRENIKNMEKHQQELMEEQQNYQRAVYDNDYLKIRQCLFSTLLEIGDVIDLVKPEKLSQLDSPCRTFRKGNVLMHQYLVLKKGNTNTDKIKDMLQLRFNQKLSAFEFPGITQTNFVYGGSTYPLLFIDDVRDQTTYVQIDITWASKNYIELLNARAQARMECLEPQKNNILNDNDF